MLEPLGKAQISQSILWTAVKISKTKMKELDSKVSSSCSNKEAHIPFCPPTSLPSLPVQSDGSESEMGLALNRYIGNSILPALISHSNFYAEADQHAPLLDATLHTVYRLSKCKVSASSSPSFFS